MSHSATVTCLCGAITQSINLDQPLPYPSEICHCNPCRLTSGSLGSSFVTITNKSLPHLDKCTAYKSSPPVTRYFCSTCGTHLFVDGWGDPDAWRVNAGCVEREASQQPNTAATKPDILSIQYHGFVSDTVDGGIAPWLPEIDGRHIPSYDSYGDNPETRTEIDPLTLPSKNDEGKRGVEEKLLAQCYCGGVAFDILRSQRPVTKENWWLRKGDHGTKFRAAFCVCRSCRLALGQPLMPWTYVETASLRNSSTGAPIGESVASAAEKGLLGTLKLYQSTPGVWHDFCGKCGASVFYRSEGRTRDLGGAEVVDVAVGILRPGGAVGVDETNGVGAGVRCEGWLQWELDRVSFREDGLETEMIEALLKNGLKADSKG